MKVWKTFTVQLRDIITPITTASAKTGTACPASAAAARRALAAAPALPRILQSR